MDYPTGLSIFGSPPFPHEQNYNPLYGLEASFAVPAQAAVPVVAVGPAPAAAPVAKAGVEDDYDESESDFDESLSDNSEAVVPLAGVAPEVSAALINKLREKAYENR
jgi:hypothetical protein